MWRGQKISFPLPRKPYQKIRIRQLRARHSRKAPHVLEETSDFSAENVHGAYAKTKALATKAVLEFSRHGLDAVVVHPSGILGPYDCSGNHLVQLVSDYVSGKLPACVKGGYDFVDVRDVAAGILAAGGKGKKRGNVLSSPTVTTKSVKFSILSNRFPAAKTPRPPCLAGEAGTAFRQARRKAQKTPSAVYEIFPVYAFQQRQIFSRKGDERTRLQTERFIRNSPRYGSLAQTKKGPSARPCPLNVK